MKSTFAIGIALLIVALPLAAAAQSPRSDGSDLSIERKQKRSIVLPKPSQEQMRRDADQAVSEYAAGQAAPGRLVNQTSPVRPSSRPDLDYDVKSGIQSQRLGESLRGK
jgi:hypothetical protein